MLPFSLFFPCEQLVLLCYLFSHLGRQMGLINKGIVNVHTSISSLSGENKTVDNFLLKILNIHVDQSTPNIFRVVKVHLSYEIQMYSFLHETELCKANQPTSSADLKKDPSVNGTSSPGFMISPQWDSPSPRLL